MANQRLAAQLQPFTLFGSGSSLGDTSITLTTFNSIDGVALSMSDFGTKGYMTMEPGSSSQEEQVSFSGVTTNSNGTVTLTGVMSVGFLSPYTETSGLSKSHAGATRVVVSNTSGFYNDFTNKYDDETIAGSWSFTETLGVGAVISSDVTKAATVQYVNDTAIAGAPNASTSVKGIVQESTAAQDLAGTAAGSTGAQLFPSPANLSATRYFTLTTVPNGTDTYVATCRPTQTALTSGSTFAFTPDVANTGAATLNVDGLGALAITKFGAALKTNDLTAGHQQLLQYEGSSTSFRLVSLGGRTLQGQDGQETQSTCTNVSNAYSTVGNPPYIAYVTGMKVRFIAPATNSGASTLNVDGLGAKTVVLSPATALVGGEIVINAEIEATYDGTNFQMSVVPAGLISGISTPLTTLHAHKQVPLTSSYDISTASGNQVIAHGLGVAPNWVKIRTYLLVTNGTLTLKSDGMWNSAGTYGLTYVTDTVIAQSTTQVAYVNHTSNGHQVATVGSVDATNVTLAWVKTSTPTGTAYFEIECGV